MKQYKDLLLMLTLRDIKIRYKESFMGLLWALLMPILIVGSGLVVMIGFAAVSGRSVDKMDVLSVAIKAVPWAFFVSALRFATSSLIMNKELVTKIYFPREILPLAAVLANLFDFAVAAGVLTIVVLFVGVPVSLQLAWIPLLLALLVLLTVGIGILLACANLFFRDVKYLVEVALTYGVFFTPVFYSVSKMGKWGPALLLNPVGPILEALDSTVVHHRAPSLQWLAYSAAWACIGSLMSLKLFQKAEAVFAERV